jgi:hypothetical protein
VIDTDRPSEPRPSPDDRGIVEATIKRAKAILHVATESGTKIAMEVLRDSTQCAGCIAYKRDKSEAPYTMYNDPRYTYYRDCLHCPIGVTLGECSADGSTWRAAHEALKHDDVKALDRVIDAAIKKLQAALSRWK